MTDIHLLRPPRRHLISIGDLTRDDVTRLLSTARNFERSLEPGPKPHPRATSSG